MTYILIGYMWLFIHRPFEIWPATETIHLERVYMLMAIACWGMSGRVRWAPNFLHLTYLAFAISLLVCWLASPWSGTANAQVQVENYFKMLVFYVMFVTTVRTETELKTICLGFLGVMGLYMTHSYREYLSGHHEYRMGIVRMTGVDRSLGDPNSFSASVLYALPFVVPAYSAMRGWGFWRRILPGGYLALSVLCIVLTGSRGAFTGLVLYAAVLVLKSRKRVTYILLALVFSPLLWFLIPAELQMRFYTIIDPSVGPSNAKVSADSRAQGLWIGLALLQDSPVTGAGPGAWIPASGRMIESHNLYGQVAGEMGLLGVLSFLSIVLAIGANIWAIKAVYTNEGRPKDFLYLMADAVGMATILLLFMGYGSHSLFRFSWLWYGAFLVAARASLDQSLAEKA